MAFFCFQDKRNGLTVEFETWENFANLLLEKPAVEVARELAERKIDCVFGTIDLSIE